MPRREVIGTLALDGSTGYSDSMGKRGVAKSVAGPPGLREGGELSLDFTKPQDVGLLRQAIRRGWIKSLDRMERLIAMAEESVATVSDREELAKLRVSLARVAAQAAGVHVRSVVAVDGAQPAVQNNTQINVGADLSKLTVEQLKALAGA